MGILDNFESYLEKAESAWDEEFHFESKQFMDKDDHRINIKVRNI